MQPQKLSLVARLHNNPDAQRILLLITIIYVLSPVDITPDTIPVVGWIDDLTIILAEITQYMIYVRNKKSEFKAIKKLEDSRNNEEIK